MVAGMWQVVCLFFLFRGKKNTKELAFLFFILSSFWSDDRFLVIGC